MGSNDKPKKKVPPPFAATTADPGGRDGTSAWVQKDMEYKASQSVRDFSTGSEAGFNN